MDPKKQNSKALEISTSGAPVPQAEGFVTEEAISDFKQKQRDAIARREAEANAEEGTTEEAEAPTPLPPQPSPDTDIESIQD